MTFAKIRVRDRVKILSGKNKGREGEVLHFWPKKRLVMVKGVNLVKRHLKASNNRAAGIFESEKAISISKVGLFCSTCQKARRVGVKNENGKKVRFCKKCQSLL